MLDLFYTSIKRTITMVSANGIRWPIPLASTAHTINWASRVRSDSLLASYPINFLNRIRRRRKPSGASCTTKYSWKEPLRLSTISSGASVIGELANSVVYKFIVWGRLNSNPPGCQWSSYISKVGPLPNWTSVLTMQVIPDQSHCQLNSVARGGGHGHTAHWD